MSDNRVLSFIQFSNVSKKFLRGAQRQLIRNRLTDILKRRPREYFYALSGVSFRIAEGENVAIIGSNGAGKSTLLSLVAGLSRPDQGTVRVDGRVAALLELGSGFHGDLTGRENLFLNASLLGLSRRRTEQIAESVIEFSGLGDFIEEPMRTYSSGMIMRLAFAIAVNVEPNFLIVDEVLAVGDQAFQQKCFDKIQELHDQGKTLLCVSHSPAMIKTLCQRALWLDHGQLMMDGPIDDVMAAYHGRTVAHQ